MKHEDIKNGMKVRVTCQKNGIHPVGTVGTVGGLDNHGFRVITGPNEAGNWYTADMVEEVEEEKKMKAIVKGGNEDEMRRRGNTSTGWAGPMTSLIGQEIVVETLDKMNGRQRYSGAEWTWEEDWLEFKKEETKVEEKDMKNEKIEKLERDIEATKKSLLKWKINTALLEDGTRDGVKITSSECPLCNLYSGGICGGERCDGCPIKERSDRGACAGTPYEKCVNLMSDNKMDEAAIESALEVEYLANILKDLRCRLEVEKARVDRPPYHKDFAFTCIYKNTGIAEFVKVCVQSKRPLKLSDGDTETVVIDDIADCRDEDDRYEGQVFYEVSLVDEDDESDAITSFPTIKDAIAYAGKFGCHVEEELRNLEGKE